MNTHPQTRKIAAIILGVLGCILVSALLPILTATGAPQKPAYCSTWQGMQNEVGNRLQHRVDLGLSLQAPYAANVKRDVDVVCS
jgi:hypothetical protein